MNKQMQNKMYWLHCLSPLHVGAGEGAEYIDNPIMREKVTGWPFVPGSSIKGVIAARHGAGDEKKRPDNPLLKAAFGSGGADQANAGALIFTDAHLICFPVRSLRGTFAWITSPLVLQRLKRDYSGFPKELPLDDFQKEKEVIYVASAETLAMGVNEKQGGNQTKVFLEDLDLICRDQEKKKIGELAKLLAGILWAGDKQWHEIFKNRFAIVHDEVFSFLTKTATQVDTRIRINPEQKTVADGALWTEEYLPAETILAGVVWQDNELLQRKKAESECKKIKPDDRKKYYKDEVLQLGGNATIGRGQVRCVFEPKENK
ncbi:MAG: type III-B CRISPR module RAMP protein Cmr4 [Cystobacterineae bacterium]|nr:type III-B CRISPR module RAMP protein Cmr4 [Cystobacterineae bacterium]